MSCTLERIGQNCALWPWIKNPIQTREALQPNYLSSCRRIFNRCLPNPAFPVPVHLPLNLSRDPPKKKKKKSYELISLFQGKAASWLVSLGIQTPWAPLHSRKAEFALSSWDPYGKGNKFPAHWVAFSVLFTPSKSHEDMLVAAHRVAGCRWLGS